MSQIGNGKAGNGKASKGNIYTTPYMSLMRKAVEFFNISDDHQPKHAVLVEWFCGKKIEGKKITKKIAGDMASLVCLPSSHDDGAPPPKKRSKNI